MESVDCVVIGAGVIGLAVARELALQGREVLILEAEDSIGQHTSSRNSEVIHAGLYYPNRAPFVAVGDYVYVAAGEGKLWALDAKTGAVARKFDTTFPPCRLLVDNGVVAVVCWKAGTRLGGLVGVDEEMDPREAILRHGGKEDVISKLTAAYAKTQPKPIFAEPSEEEKDGAEEGAAEGGETG